VPRSSHPATAPAAHTLRRQNHLQHLVGVFEEVLEFVARGAQHLLCKLRGHFDSSHRGVFRDVADFIHLNTGFSRERRFQLFGQGRRLGVSARKGAHKSRELRLRKIGGKMNAGDTGSDQKLREASFAGCGAQRHAVQQNLRSGRAEQHAASAAVLQRVAQLFPRRFKLLRRLRVPELVQPREFQQNVQAADKRPRPASLFLNHSCRRYTLPPPRALLTVESPSPRHKPRRAPCTHLNNRFPYRFGNFVAIGKVACPHTLRHCIVESPSVDFQSADPNWTSELLTEADWKEDRPPSY
jgi:hypothetical protein